MKKTFWILLCVSVFGIMANAQSSLWDEYKNSDNKGVETTLADYSHAGYHYCEKELPVISKDNYTYFNVKDYGAIPDDAKSDRKAVLLALDAAQKHSGKAVLYFPAGKYNLNGMEDFGERPLIVTKSNLVLKGEGQDKTELYFDQPCFLASDAFITFIPSNPYDSYWRGDEVIADVMSYPAKGGYHLNVSNADQFKPGMVVNIDADLNTETDRGKAYFIQHEIPAGVKAIEDYFFELHQVDKVEGNTVYFKEPIHLDLPTMENTKIRVVYDQIEESGIQDMTLSGNYRGQYRHHSCSRFAERYDLIKFSNAINCWARNIRMKDYSTAMNVYRSIANTFMNINLTGNTGHNSLGGSYSYGNLFAYCRENTQTHHGFGGDHSWVASVFLRCNQYDGLEAHCAWPRASLYDLNMGGFNPRPGGAQKFPHHGKDLCFWNWNVNKGGENDFWPDGSNYGYFMPFVVAGLHGSSFTIKDMDTDLLAYESMGTKITAPESLFEAQLKERLGSVPDWLVEESEIFESVSRYSGIQIQSPVSFTEKQIPGEIKIELQHHSKMDPSIVKHIDILRSTQGIQSGFTKVASFDGWTNELSIPLTQPGTHVIKAVMINNRNEVEESLPVTVFVGNSDALTKLPIVKATMMSHSVRSSLYGELTAAGGGEATSFPDNNAYSRYTNGTPFYQVEKDFYAQHLVQLEKFNLAKVKPIFDDPANIQEAEKLIDGKSATAINNVYGYVGSFIQFDLGAEYNLSKLEFQWNTSMTTPIKLEVHTSSDEKAWYSAVNDEPLWEFGVQRIGETLQRKRLPSGQISEVYLPQRRCRYVRLFVQNFPNGKLAEVRFFGGDIPLLKSLMVNGAHPASWNPHINSYEVSVEAGSDIIFHAKPMNENHDIIIDEAESYPGKTTVTVVDHNGSSNQYEVNISLAGTYMEDFERLDHSGSFESSFIGNNNIEWWVTARVGPYMGTGTCVYYYPSQDGISSVPIAGGLTEFSFDAQHYRQSGERKITVSVNDSIVMDSVFAENSEIYRIEKKGLQFSGDIVLKIENTTSETKALAIDNISWKGFAPDRNANLKYVTINGTSLETFKKDSFYYQVLLDPPNTMPELNTEAESSNATYNITYPESLPGEATIKVTASNGAWSVYSFDLGPSLSINQYGTSDLHFYPNPTRNRIHFTNSKTIKSIALFDAAGKVMIPGRNANSIDLSSLSNGIYLLSISYFNGFTATKKLIKQN